MGILSCYRSGCGNIMCDRYSHVHGYICEECFEELVDLGIHKDIYDFMSSKKQHLHKDAALMYFDEIFPDNRKTSSDY